MANFASNFESLPLYYFSRSIELKFLKPSCNTKLKEILMAMRTKNHHKRQRSASRLL